MSHPYGGIFRKPPDRWPVRRPHIHRLPRFPNFSRAEDAFVLAAVSTEPPLAKGLSRVDSRALPLSHSSQFDIEEHLLHVGGMLDRDVEPVAWTKDVPIAEEHLVGVPERASQSQASAEMVLTNEPV